MVGNLILSELKILHNLIKISYKTIWKKMINENDIFLKLMFIILKNYMKFVKIYHF